MRYREFGDTGMQLILSPRLPAVVKEELPRLVDGFLRSRGLDRSDLVHYLTHPGGAKENHTLQNGQKLRARMQREKRISFSPCPEG